MADMIERTNFPGTIETGNAPFCSIVQDHNYAYLAGIVAADFPDGRAVLGDIIAETTAVMRTVRQLLTEIGLSMANIVRCDVHLTDLNDMPAMNAAYAPFFPDGSYPSRTCTQTGALFGGSKIEITCIARRAAGQRQD